MTQLLERAVVGGIKGWMGLGGDHNMHVEENFDDGHAKDVDTHIYTYTYIHSYIYSYRSMLRQDILAHLNHQRRCLSCLGCRGCMYALLIEQRRKFSNINQQILIERMLFYMIRAQQKPNSIHARIDNI